MINILMTNLDSLNSFTTSFFGSKRVFLGFAMFCKVVDLDLVYSFVKQTLKIPLFDRLRDSKAEGLGQGRDFTVCNSKDCLSLSGRTCRKGFGCFDRSLKSYQFRILTDRVPETIGSCLLVFQLQYTISHRTEILESQTVSETVDVTSYNRRVTRGRGRPRPMMRKETS